MIRVVLLDDEVSVRRGLRLRLELEPDIQVVGECGDVGTAIDLALSQAADVMVLDGELAGAGAATAAVKSTRAATNTHVIVVSLRDDERRRTDALASGARALVSKTSPDGALVAAIRAAALEAALFKGDQK
ncbi:MAG: response regulator [Dehalococcoidia bacterium]